MIDCIQSNELNYYLDKKQAKIIDSIKKIKECLQCKEVVKNSEIVRFLDLSPARVRVILSEMDEVEIIGDKRTRKYRLKKDK